MVVTCPNCGSRYAVDPLAIGPAGRTVQCAGCHHRWFQKVEGVAPLPDVVTHPTSGGGASALPAVIPPKREFAWRRLVAVAIVVVVLAAVTLFAFRREIAAMISYEARASTPVQLTADAPLPAPRTTVTSSAPAATASAAVPTAAPSPPSVVRATANNAAPSPDPAARPARPPQVEAARPNLEVDLASSKIDVVDGRYVVRGQIVNNGKTAGSTTLLRLTFRKNDDVLGERSFPMVEGPLPPGGRTSFTQTLDDPPSGTTDIVPVVE
jgi:predicted Zn finger-like uncharacterized protein